MNSNKPIKVIGNNKKDQKVIKTKLAGSLKSSNQANPRSGGTTLVYVVKRKRNELGKKVRKDYEKGKVKKRMCEMRDWEAVPQQHSNTLSGVQIDNLIIQPKGKKDGHKKVQVTKLPEKT